MESFCPGTDMLIDFEPMELKNGNVIRYDDGQVILVWPSGRREELADAGSLCGLERVWATSIHDAFVDCCAWHDRAYDHRAFFENHGWNREGIDDYFLELMGYIAGQKTFFARMNLEIAAREYHFFTRSFGGFVYYKHPAGDPSFDVEKLVAGQRTPMFQLMHSTFTSEDDPWGKKAPQAIRLFYQAQERLLKQAKAPTPLLSRAQQAAKDLKAANPRSFIVAYLSTDDKIVLSADADRFTTQMGILERARFLLNMLHDGFISEEGKRK